MRIACLGLAAALPTAFYHEEPTEMIALESNVDVLGPFVWARAENSDEQAQLSITKTPLKFTVW